MFALGVVSGVIGLLALVKVADYLSEKRDCYVEKKRRRLSTKKMYKGISL